MAWNMDYTIKNHYKCAKCGTKWEDVWDCEVDDECPHCETLMTPFKSEALDK